MQSAKERPAPQFEQTARSFYNRRMGGSHRPKLGSTMTTDVAIILDERFQLLINSAPALRNCMRAAVGLRAPHIFRPAVISSGAISPTTGCCVTTRPRAAVSVFRNPAGYSNGNTVDRQGRLISCEHGNRRVSRTEHDGTITVIASHYQGKRLNSPNDVVVHSDGAIWFTDPAYGIESDYEGHKAESEIGACHVYRVSIHPAVKSRALPMTSCARTDSLFSG